MVELNVPEGIQSRLFNHTAAVTAYHFRPKWELLRKWAEKVQEYAFRSAPNLHNAFLSEGVEALQAPPPHVPTPPKKRPGRPRKGAKAETAGAGEA